MIMTKTLVLIMLRFDSFVQGREAHLDRERGEHGGHGTSNGQRDPIWVDDNQKQPGRSAPRVLANFVVLEGLDGSGTTTQLHLAEGRLESMGLPHFCTGEPTKGPVGRLIRRILERKIQAGPDTVALLFAADRSEHLYEKTGGIVSRLRRGEVVVCDRYLFSSLAYQSLACDPRFVFSLNHRFPLPQHVVFLDTPVTMSQERLTHRSKEGPELYDEPEIQQEILSAYERGFRRFSGAGMQLHRLDGSREPQVVFEKFWSILQGLPIVKR
jgi:dTMP kinase